MPITLNGNGTVTGLAVGGLPDGSVDADTLASGVGGKVLQVQTTTKTDVFSQTGIATNTGAISNDAISVNITPSNASNKILLIAHLSVGLNSDNEVNWTFHKDGSILSAATGDDTGNNRKRRTSVGDCRWSGTHHTIGGQFVDTAGGTSQITYSIRLGAGHNGTAALYLNRHSTNDNYTYDFNTQSTITAVEISS